MRPQLLILIAAVFQCFTGFAGDFDYGRSVTINTPQHSDLYIAGGNVTINAPVYGDVIVAGGQVTINDSVMSDVLVAGGKVTIRGFVNDDIRGTGGHVVMSGTVRGDVVAAAGIIEFEENAIASSITATGGRVLLAGRSLNDVNIAAGEFTLTGVVEKNAIVKGGTLHIKGTIKGKASLAASEDIRVYSGAKIGRGVQYWLPFKRILEIPADVSASQPVFNPLLSITHQKWYFLGASTFVGLLWYLGMAFVVILLIQYFFPVTFFRAGIQAHAHPVRSGLFGLGYIICVPICALLMLVTVIGLPITITLATIYFTTLVLATIISAVVAVNWMCYLSERQYGLLKMSGMALVAFALFKVITFTPFFGALLMMLIVLISFGAIMSSIRWKPIRTEERTVQRTSISASVQEA